MRAPLLVLPALLLAGCLAEPSAVEGPQGEAVPFRTLARGGSHQGWEPATLVLASADEWEAFWSGIDSRPAPRVDYARERVLAFVDEERPDGCWSATVASIERLAPYGLLARVQTDDGREPAPDPGEERVCSAAWVRPYHLVAFEDRDTPVTVQTVGPPRE